MNTKSNKPKPRAKAKEQKAVSRAVKQAGFKNIKEAKQALNKANKKVKTACDSSSCWEDSESCCNSTAAYKSWTKLNDIISCQYKFDPVENCDILVIKIQS